MLLKIIYYTIPVLFLLAGGFLIGYAIKKVKDWPRSPEYIIGVIWAAYGLGFTVVNLMHLTNR